MARIISPVTSLESAKMVIEAGCDEIYCGVRMGKMKYVTFNGRPASCSIPTYEELGEVVKYAHARGIKVSLTANLPFMAEMIEKVAIEYLKKSIAQGVDALIVADIGALLLMQKMKIDLPLYGSSFLVTRNSYAIKFLKNLNVNRIIASPDLTLEELKELVVRNPEVEIEAFLHGEGCSNVGGSCYLLHSFRSPEKTFRPYDQNKVLEIAAGKSPLPEDFINIHHRNPCLFYFDTYSFDKKESYGSATILDAYVFCSLCALPRLLETRVSGLKIVGRCNSPSFQARTTRVYRKFINLLEKEGEKRFFEELKKFQRENREMKIVCSKKRCFYPLEVEKNI